MGKTPRRQSPPLRYMNDLKLQIKTERERCQLEQDKNANSSSPSTPAWPSPASYT